MRLLQVCDSSFPTGGFAFSNGLEGIAERGLLRGEDEVAQVILVLIEEGFGGVELPAMVQAHRAAVGGEIERLVEVDNVLTAMKPVPALRAASLKVGRGFLASATGLVEDAVVGRYWTIVEAGATAGHHAVAFGVVSGRMGIDEERAATAFGSILLTGQTAAAVRLGIIGQGAAQRIIVRLQPAVLDAVAKGSRLALDEIGAYQPMVDVAALRQPSLVGRLFAS